MHTVSIYISIDPVSAVKEQFHLLFVNLCKEVLYLNDTTRLVSPPTAASAREKTPLGSGVSFRYSSTYYRLDSELF